VLLPLALGTAAAHAVDLGNNLSVGGALTVTSDYIYRGVSESEGRAAGQVDLHLASTGGSFLGVWASTRYDGLAPYAQYVIEPYIGHRFDLGNAWTASLGARAHLLVGGDQEINDDTEEVSGSLTYLDVWSVSVTAIPNAVRYWFYRRLSRTPAYVADTSVQWLIDRHFFLTAGVGYYYSTGTGPGIERATGYLYGDAGVACEYRSWRLDVSYFFAQEAAQRLFPYPSADGRVAATLTWRF
jgi:uncharacterized protein (TIGR02001 family)